MRLLLFLIIPIMLFSQNVEKTLEKLLHYKSVKTHLEVNYSPFQQKVIPKQNKIEKVKKTSSKYTLKAIFNNKAFINNKWYAKGDMLGAFKIVNISKETVFMKKGSSLKNLKLENIKKYIEVKEK